MFFAPASAPCCSSSSTVESLPFAAARCRAVSPQLKRAPNALERWPWVDLYDKFSLRFFATESSKLPHSSTSLTSYLQELVTTLPLLCRGPGPSFLFPSMGALFFSSSSTLEPCPFAAAICRAVEPRRHAMETTTLRQPGWSGARCFQTKTSASHSSRATCKEAQHATSFA